MDLPRSQVGEVGGEDPQEPSGHGEVQVFILKALRTTGGFRLDPRDTGCQEPGTRKNNVASSVSEADEGNLAPDGAGHPGELKRGSRRGEMGFGKHRPQAGCFPV